MGKKYLMFIYVQVILRWGLERGLSVVTKSANSERIAQNLDLFSFKLSDQDIKYAWRGVNAEYSWHHRPLCRSIGALDRGLRLNDPGYFCPLLYNTHCPIWSWHYFNTTLINTLYTHVVVHWNGLVSGSVGQRFGFYQLSILFNLKCWLIYLDC